MRMTPHDSESDSSEDRIHDEFQVVTRCRVAMKEDGSRFLEDTAKLYQACCHHGEVRHHVVFF